MYIEGGRSCKVETSAFNKHGRSTLFKNPLFFMQIHIEAAQKNFMYVTIFVREWAQKNITCSSGFCTLLPRVLLFYLKLK